MERRTIFIYLNPTGNGEEFTVELSKPKTLTIKQLHYILCTLVQQLGVAHLSEEARHLIEHVEAWQMPPLPREILG